MKEGQRSKAPEVFDLLQQQPEQRPHSSVGHYDGQSRRARPVDSKSSSSDHSNLLLLRDKEKVNVNSSVLISGKINEEPSEFFSANDELTKGEKTSDDEVELRSPSRKVSQDRPRLDKSQSTPTYDLVVGDTSSFEEKLRDIRLFKQNRVDEDGLAPITEASNHSTSPSPVSSKFQLLQVPF